MRKSEAGVIGQKHISTVGQRGRAARNVLCAFTNIFRQASDYDDDGFARMTEQVTLLLRTRWLSSIHKGTEGESIEIITDQESLAGFPWRAACLCWF